IDAGRRNGGPKDEVLTCLRLYGRGRTREDRRNHGCKSCAAEHWFLPPIESLASPAWLAPELVILSITRIFEGTIDRIVRQIGGAYSSRRVWRPGTFRDARPVRH